jgi:hypothetical protein
MGKIFGVVKTDRRRKKEEKMLEKSPIRIAAASPTARTMLEHSVRIHTELQKFQKLQSWRCVIAYWHHAVDHGYKFGQEKLSYNK